MSSISDLFEQSNSDTITHRGRVVRSLVRIPIRNGDRLLVSRLRVDAPRPQGIKLAVNRGVLDVNGKRAPAIALWSDSSPATVELTVRGNATTLEVWNAWSLGGVDSSWLGNAGIVTKPTSTGHLLRCSDGVGPPSYSDLEVEIDVRR